jgi:uncharacterized protein
VPTKTYDETIKVLRTSVEKARIGEADKFQALKKLSQVAAEVEKDFVPNENFSKIIEKERTDSYKYGGRTVFGKAVPPNGQLRLF